MREPVDNVKARTIMGSDDALKATGQLHRLGQSLWLDNITRDLLMSGTLQRYIDELSVTGLTSNPTIFENAIKNSSAYDTAIAARIAQGKSGEDLFFDLAIEDLTKAADLFDRSTIGRTAWMAGCRSKCRRCWPMTRPRPSRRPGSLRPGRPPEPDDQDPRNHRGSARHRGIHLRRHSDQRHTALLARALCRRR